MSFGLLETKEMDIASLLCEWKRNDVSKEIKIKGKTKNKTKDVAKANQQNGIKIDYCSLTFKVSRFVLFSTATFDHHSL